VGEIGRGAFATVYKVTSKFDGLPYAAKELDKTKFMRNGILDQKVENEMKIMQRVKHVSIHFCRICPGFKLTKICRITLFNTLSTLIGTTG